MFWYFFPHGICCIVFWYPSIFLLVLESWLLAYSRCYRLSLNAVEKCISNNGLILPGAVYTKSASLSVKLCLCILYLAIITRIPKENATEMSTKLPEWARREKLKAVIFCLVLSFMWYPLVEVIKPMKSSYSNCPLPPVLPLWTGLFWSTITGDWVGVCRAWWSFPTRKMGGCARVCQIHLICM